LTSVEWLRVKLALPKKFSENGLRSDRVKLSALPLWVLVSSVEAVENAGLAPLFGPLVAPGVTQYC
jgi:hypothetical protein